VSSWLTAFQSGTVAPWNLVLVTVDQPRKGEALERVVPAAAYPQGVRALRLTTVSLALDAISTGTALRPPATHTPNPEYSWLPGRQPAHLLTTTAQGVGVPCHVPSIK
jgi:hypothetical protein